MKRAGEPAGHDFGDNRVPGAGQRVRECLTERPELDNQISLTRNHFMAADWPSRLGAGCAAMRAPQATRGRRRRAKDGGEMGPYQRDLVV